MDSTQVYQPIELSFLPSNLKTARQLAKNTIHYMLGLSWVGLLLSIAMMGWFGWQLCSETKVSWFLFGFYWIELIGGVGLFFLCRKGIQVFYAAKKEGRVYTPTITLSAAGLFVKYAVGSIRAYAWDEIDSFAIDTLFGHKSLLVFNRRSLKKSAPRFKQGNIFLNQSFYGFDEILTLGPYYDAQQVLSHCQQWHRSIYPDSPERAIPHSLWWQSVKRWDSQQDCYRTSKLFTWGGWGTFLSCYAFLVIYGLSLMGVNFAPQPTPLLSEFKGSWQSLATDCCENAELTKTTWDPQHLERNGQTVTFRVRRDMEQLPYMYFRDVLLSKTIIDTYTLNCSTDKITRNRSIDIFTSGERHAENNSALTNYSYQITHGFTPKPIYLYHYAKPETVAYIKQEACQLQPIEKAGSNR